jgi:hypothetical protein
MWNFKMFLIFVLTLADDCIVLDRYIPSGVGSGVRR